MAIYGVRRRAKETAEGIPAFLVDYLTTGKRPTCTCPGGEHSETCVVIEFGLYELGMDGPSLDDLWRQHRETILTDWIRRRPGTRAFGWWAFDVEVPLVVPDACSSMARPEFRQLVSGVARLAGCYRCDSAWGLPHVSAEGVDSPRFESQATYLKRAGLLHLGEGARVPASGWQPEAVMWRPARSTYVDRALVATFAVEE